MNFTIYAPRFNERGGVLALHNLCRLLNEAGYSSAIWPSDKRLPGSLKNTIRTLYRNSDQALFGGFRIPLYRKIINQPVASRCFLEKSIVVYPEIQMGNPLNARKIVRWILASPKQDFLNKFSLNDGNIFYWREKFLHPDLGYMKNRRLRTPYYPLHIMDRRPLSRKNKFCFIRHKNKEAISVDLGQNAINLDGMNTYKITEVFRRTEYFVSYDLETGYTRLAILCGAVPIVVPNGKTPKEVWRPVEKERLGIAYGFDDKEIEWAQQTRDLAIAEIISSCEQAKQQASKFAEEVVKLYS